MPPTSIPSDLQRVEVLRGPQGTLYGAESLGGLIKYVTVDPSTDALSSRVQVDGNGVHNGDGIGYGARAAVNVPISDTLAFRAVASTVAIQATSITRQLDIDGVNQSETRGGRVSALWKPAQFFSVKLGALIQDLTTHGASTALVGSGLGDLQQDLLRGTGANRVRTQLYTATINAKLGRIDLTSVSGYSDEKITGTSDYSPFIGAPTAIFNATETKRFTQEIRLSSTIGSAIDWLVGGFYNHETSPADQQLQFWNAASGTRPTSLPT